ncbi:MAG: hypothetical protein J6A69_00380 [Clostridia bacterium]|nr:hypothetical protein [Clostridia bacterium]
MKNIMEVDKNFKHQSIDKTDIKLYDVRKEPFKIYGCYLEESGEKFRRVPENVAKNMNDCAYFLHTCTAGVRVRFKTDSQYVALKAVMPTVSLMPAMAVTGSCGFDLYADGHYFNTFVPPIKYEDRFRATYDVYGGYESIINFPDRKMRDIIINFPLYSDVSDVILGLQEDAKLLEGNKYTYEKPIVFYGSSITEGGSASRPGNSYEAVISRRLDSNYLNLGFSGSAVAEKTIAEYISNLDMSVFVYDYDHNSPNPEHYKKTHKPMFDIIREKNPDLPVIMVTRPNTCQSEQIEERIKIAYETYETALKNGDKNVYFINGQDILNYSDPDMMTVDGCHPNDFGFWCMAEVIGKKIKEVLK